MDFESTALRVITVVRWFVNGIGVGMAFDTFASVRCSFHVAVVNFT